MTRAISGDGPDLLDFGSGPDGCGECGMDPCGCPEPVLSGAEGPVPSDGEGPVPSDGEGPAAVSPRTMIEIIAGQPSEIGRRVTEFVDTHMDELLNALRGPALAALAQRRVAQIALGHDRAADLARPPAELARKALSRLRDCIDLTGDGDPPPGRIPDALVKAEIAGALLLALHDRLTAEMGAERG